MRLKNGSELIISEAAARDAGECIEYLNIVGGESDYLTFGKDEFQIDVATEERFIEEMAQADTSVILIGRIDGELACMGSLSGQTKARLAHQSDLGITVKKKFWNIGAGKAMMEALIGFARQNSKIEIVHLGVRSDNVKAISLYKKLGFEEIADSGTCTCD